MKNNSKLKSSGLLMLALTFLLFTSCSNPDSLKTIPKDANAVSVIDVFSIAKKGKLYEIADLKFFKTLKKEIRNENKKVARILDDVIENPTLPGIDFTSDMFLYYVNESKEERYVCLSAEIQDEEKFSEFIENVLDKSDIEFDIETEKKYKYTLIGSEIGIGWDEDKVVFIAAENYSSRENIDVTIETLLDLKEKQQITENENFNNFYKEKKDFSVWVSSNLFENQNDFKQLAEVIDFDMSDNYVSAYLDFDDEEISLSAEFTPNKEIKKIMEENNVWDNEFNTKLLNFFPKETYAVASFSINPMSYYNILKEEDDFEKISSKFKENTEIELKDVFKNIKGNLIYSLFGFENVEYTYLAWGYGFDESKATLLDDKYEISKAGDISEENMALLNEGKTIQAESYSGKYCINIKNILDQGGNAESAIASDSKINWYEDGWEYGNNIETTKTEYLPIMGLAFDINDSKIIKQLIEKIPEEEIKKRSSYYEFSFANRYPTYLAFDENTFFVTNDLKSAKSFKNGGNSTNLSKSDIESNISDNSLFSFINLDYDQYPKDIRKKIEENQNDKEEKALEIWNSFAKSVELKSNGNNSLELIFRVKNTDENSLNFIVTTLDDNYKDLMNF